jgi:hypothetical protein
LKRESLITWAVVVGLLLFAAVASAVVPFVLDQPDTGRTGSGLTYEPEAKPVVIKLDAYVLGDQLVQLPLLGHSVSLFGLEIGPLNGTLLSQFQAAGILTAMVLMGIVVAGVPLAFIYYRLGRTVVHARKDEAFAASLARLDEKDKATTRALQRVRPVREGLALERRRRWSAFGLSLMILVVVWFSALALGKAIYGDAPQSAGDRLVDPARTFTLVTMGLAVLAMVIWGARTNLAHFDETVGEDRPISWGMLWVLLSGLLVVGVGLGLTLAVRGG